MHAEAAPKLCETWLADYTEKVLQLAKNDGKLPALDVDDMTPGKLKLLFVVLQRTCDSFSFYHICLYV